MPNEMDGLEKRVRILRDYLYANRNTDQCFSELCDLMKPVVRNQAKHFLKCMEGYEFDDLYQEACIVIWRIMLKRKPDIHTSVVGYLSCAIYYEYLDLYYTYALKNMHRIYTGDSYEQPGLSYYRVKEISYVQRHQEKRRESAARAAERAKEKKLAERASRALIEAEKALSDEELTAIKKEKDELVKAKRRFVANERNRLDSSGIVRTVSLSARLGNPEKGEPDFVLIRGKNGPTPYGAAMSSEEYLAYLQKKFPNKNITELKYDDIIFPDEKREKRLKQRREYYRRNRTEISKKAAARYITHKEEIQKKQREYRAEHREEINARRRERDHKRRPVKAAKQRLYVRENREKVYAANRAYQQAHKEEIKAQRKKYREDHCEEIREKKAEYYAAHREENRKKSHDYYYAHRDEIRQKYREHSEAHRDEINAQARQRIADEIELSKTDPVIAAKREARLEKRREWSRKHKPWQNYYQTHKEQIKEKRQNYYAAHREEICAKRRQKYAEAKPKKETEAKSVEVEEG